MGKVITKPQTCASFSSATSVAVSAVLALPRLSPPPDGTRSSCCPCCTTATRPSCPSYSERSAARLALVLAGMLLEKCAVVAPCYEESGERTRRKRSKRRRDREKELLMLEQ